MPALYGSLVASPQMIRHQGRPTPVFVFPDLAVSQPGTYIIQFTLYRVSFVYSLSFHLPYSSVCSPRAPRSTNLFATHLTNAARAYLRTDPIEIVPSNQYVRPERTQLTNDIASQGIHLGS